MQLCLATEKGIIIVENAAGSWHIVRHTLPDANATSIMAREGVILAGTKDGVYRSDDNGRSWEAASHGLTQRHVRWLAYHPHISDLEFAGTEPAALFVSRDGGASWQERPEVSALRHQHGWWLPYSPQAGCVRGFAFHGSRAYAAVEVGGVLRSDDRGETWQLAAGSNGRPQFGQPPAQQIHPDVHSVATHPQSADLVFAPTGGGFYRSSDGGVSWQAVLGNCYVRAVWVDERDPQHLVLGPSDGPSGRNGRIVHSSDGGQSWAEVAGGWHSNMVERFVSAEDWLLAVMANGQLLATTRHQQDWQPLPLTLPPVTAVSVSALSGESFGV